MAKILFHELAREWWERYLLTGNKEYARESWRELEREVFPILGEKEPKKITPPMILKILRSIEDRGTIVKARKIKSHISQTMRYGIACGAAVSDPTRDIGFALTRYQSKPMATITDPAEIGQLMARIERYAFLIACARMEAGAPRSGSVAIAAPIASDPCVSRMDARPQGMRICAGRRNNRRGMVGDRMAGRPLRQFLARRFCKARSSPTEPLAHPRRKNENEAAASIVASSGNRRNPARDCAQPMAA